MKLIFKNRIRFSTINQNLKDIVANYTEISQCERVQ
jgi:hypothetical protein